MNDFVKRRKQISKSSRPAARYNRKNPGYDERQMIKLLKRVSIEEKPKFQAVRLGWIIDFYFKSKKLAIEVDEEYHKYKKQKEKDAIRQEALKKYAKITTIRITWQEIHFEPEKVIKKVEDAYNSL